MYAHRKLLATLMVAGVVALGACNSGGVHLNKGAVVENETLSCAHVANAVRASSSEEWQAEIDAARATVDGPQLAGVLHRGGLSESELNRKATGWCADHGF